MVMIKLSSEAGFTNIRNNRASSRWPLADARSKGVLLSLFWIPKSAPRYSRRKAISRWPLIDALRSGYDLRFSSDLTYYIYIYIYLGWYGIRSIEHDQFFFFYDRTSSLGTIRTSVEVLGEFGMNSDVSQGWIINPYIYIYTPLHVLLLIIKVQCYQQVGIGDATCALTHPIEVSTIVPHPGGGAILTKPEMHQERNISIGSSRC